MFGRDKNRCFFGGFPCLFPKKKQGKEGQGERGTGTAGTVFQEPKPEPEPSFPVKLY